MTSFRPLTAHQIGTSRVGAFVAPVVLVAVLGGAIVQAVVLSLQAWPGIGTPRWVGTANYEALLVDPRTVDVFVTSIVFSAISSVIIVAIASLLAAAVSAEVAGYRFYRVVWFLPGIAPAAAVAIFWTTAFQPRVGVVNLIFGAFGLPTDTALLADPTTVLIPVIVAAVWGAVGFTFLLVLGSMQQISPSIYEAARVDGASQFVQLVRITLPLARPVIITTAILNFIWTFNGFTTVWAMTRGGPGNATEILPVAVYRQAFQFVDFGGASALAVTGALFLVAIGLVASFAARSPQR